MNLHDGMVVNVNPSPEYQHNCFAVVKEVSALYVSFLALNNCCYAGQGEMFMLTFGQGIGCIRIVTEEAYDRALESWPEKEILSKPLEKTLVKKIAHFEHYDPSYKDICKGRAH